jgi:hypothetical protein
MKLLAVWVMIPSLPSVKCSAGGWANLGRPIAPSAAHGASPRRVIGVRSRESDDAVTADGRQTFPYWIREGLPVIRPEHHANPARSHTCTTRGQLQNKTLAVLVS